MCRCGILRLVVALTCGFVSGATTTTIHGPRRRDAYSLFFYFYSFIFNIFLLGDVCVHAHYLACVRHTVRKHCADSCVYSLRHRKKADLGRIADEWLIVRTSDWRWLYYNCYRTLGYRHEEKIHARGECLREKVTQESDFSTKSKWLVCSLSITHLLLLH